MVLACFRDLKASSARRATGIAVTAAAALLATAAPAEQFSAQLSRRDADGRIATGRVLVDGDNIRLETPELPDGFFIVRGGDKAAYFVRPKRGVFMDARESSPLTEILVPVDPQAPCRQFQAMADISGSADGGAQWRCERAGADTLDGRAALRYRITSPRERHYTAWIDTTRHFVARLEADDGTVIDIADVREAAQPGDAFEIPRGLRKLDPLQLIERIKHSDVWVAPQQ